MRTLYVGIVAVASMAATSHAQDRSREPAIKAAYLYNFGKYIEWPTNVFGKQDSPLVIGVVGATDVSKHLSVYTKGDKRVQGRPVEIVQWANVGTIGACHILFLSQELKSQERDEVIASMSGKPVLLVSDQNVGGVRFVVEQNRMRVQISATQVRARGLKVSSKLLQLAEVVD